MMAARRKVSRRDEKGAILPITVVLLAATLTLASYVIDIGGDRVVIRDMQSVADVVALNLARNLDGRAASGYAGFNSAGPSTTLFSAEKSSSVARQAGLFASPDTVSARLAVANQQTGEFIRWASAGDIPNAVRVYASGSSAFRMLPSTPESTTLQRSALAVIGRPIVCISAGATVADLTPGGTLDLLLGRLIGLDRLSIVSPSGIAALSAQVPLGDLATQLGVGTVDEIATANVSAQGFLVAAATVLSNKGEVAGATVLNAIAAHLSGATSLNIGSILNLATGVGSAADLNIDAFSLAQAVIEVSNKNSFINLAVPVSVPGLASIVLKAKVIEAPQIACGPVGTRARSAQVQISLTTDVTALGGLVASAKVDPLLLTVGDGYGTVTSITCSLGAATVGVSADTAVGRLKLHLLTTLLLGLTRLEVDVPDPASKPDGAAIGNSASVPMTFNFPAGSTSLPAGQTAGTGLGNLGLSSITPIKIVVIGLNVGGLLSGIVQPLLGIVDPLVSAILNPVLQGLGLRLGTVEIQPTTRPACNEPVLRG
jgi:uncharacterized membrane protein